MKIMIPTYGRSLEQKTLFNLPSNQISRVTLVVQEREASLYNRYASYCNILVLPPEIQDIATTRDFIIHTSPDPHVLMLDDDLEFFVRRDDDPSKFRTPKDNEVNRMFAYLDDLFIGGMAHIGVASREGGNRITDAYRYTDRAMRVLGFNKDILLRHNLKFAPGGFMCDFYMTLELLTRGYNNCILNWYVQNQKGSNTKGGCSTQRTPEKQEQAARNLAAAFPEFVTVVKKYTKTAWGGGERYDVRVQWKQAYRRGTSRQAALLDGRAGADTKSEGGGVAETLEQ